MTARGYAVAYALFILFLCGANAHATAPVYFQDQVFTTLDQLDQALQDGEITYDEYELLLEQFVGEPYQDADDSLRVVSADTVVSTLDERNQYRFRYRGSLRQKLGQDQALVRYDHITGRWSNFEFKLAMEQSDRNKMLVRSRSMRFRRGKSEVTLGSYNLRVGRGVTSGSSSFQSQLSEESSFGATLAQPTRNRHNGLLVRSDFGVVRSGLYFSYDKGSTYYRTITGGFCEFGRPKRSVGMVFARHQVGLDDSARAHSEFLSPYFHLASESVTISGETSLGLGASSAHVYQIQIKRPRVQQEFTIFSYARGYRNLQSGGYAYSDYADLAIERIGFEYRDKRAGRTGLAISTKADFSKDIDFGLSVNRWNNRLDNRRCAAAGSTISARDVAPLCEKLTIRALWENLDLTTQNSNRHSITLTASTPTKHPVGLETLLRIERRVRSGIETSPLTVRSEIAWRVSSDLAATVTLHYHNPNCSGASTDYLHFSFGQKLLRGKDLSVWLQMQNRYLIDKEQLDSWEARVYCDIAT